MKINADRFRQAVKRIAQAGRLLFLAAGDSFRFWRHASLSVFDHDYEQLVARIMYNVHALEKGLARTVDWAPGTGKKALKNLNDALVMYLRHGFDRGSYAYQEGLSVLQRYIERHSGNEQSIEFLHDVVSQEFFSPKLASRFGAAGVKELKKQDKFHNSEIGFYALTQGRSSVRAFTGNAIDTDKVLRALENAEKTPSVCNRQGWRVYWTENKELARQVLIHQRGFAYKQMPEVLLAITVSNSTFISPVERNQGFVDGGLYAMTVLYGLESEGLAAVPLNACLYARARSAVVRLLQIDPSEEIIMFIAVGELPEKTVVPASDRRPTSTFLRLRG